jgi:hypothetical protein
MSSTGGGAGALLRERIEELWRWIAGCRGWTADGSVVGVADKARGVGKDGHDVIGAASSQSESLDVETEDVDAFIWSRSEEGSEGRRLACFGDPDEFEEERLGVEVP